MGCDIHCFVERLEDGVWKLVPAPLTGEDLDLPYPQPIEYRFKYRPLRDESFGYLRDWFDARSYDTLSMIADVRNSAPGREGYYEPIFKPRGTPADASPEVLHEFNDVIEADGHSHTWFTLAELREYFDKRPDYAKRTPYWMQFMDEIAPLGEPDKVRVVCCFDN